MKLYYVETPAETLKRGSLNAGWHVPSTEQEISADFYITPEKKRIHSTIQKLSPGDQVLVSDSSIENPNALALAVVTENLTGNHCQVDFHKDKKGTPKFVPLPVLPESIQELVTSPNSQGIDTSSLNINLQALFDQQESDFESSKDSCQLVSHSNKQSVSSTTRPALANSAEVSREHSRHEAVRERNEEVNSIASNNDGEHSCSFSVQQEFEALQRLADALNIEPPTPLKATTPSLFSIMGLKTDKQIHLHMLTWLCDNTGSHGLRDTFVKHWFSAMEVSPQIVLPSTLLEDLISLQVSTNQESLDDSIKISTTNIETTIPLDADFCVNLSNALEDALSATEPSDDEAQFLLSNYRKFLASKFANAEQVQELAQSIYDQHQCALDTLFRQMREK